MDPIISPSFIYLLHVIQIAYGIIAIFMAASCTIMIVLIIMFFTGSADLNIIFFGDEAEKERKFRSLKRGLKLSIVTSTILVLLLVFVPTKDTLIGMYIAKQITPQNIEKAVKTGIDIKASIKADIIDIIRTINIPDTVYVSRKEE